MIGFMGIFPNKAQHELGQHFADSRSPHPCASSHGVSITSHRLIRLTSKHKIPQDLASHTNCAEGKDAVTFTGQKHFRCLISMTSLFGVDKSVYEENQASKFP